MSSVCIRTLRSPYSFGLFTRSQLRNTPFSRTPGRTMASQSTSAGEAISQAHKEGRESDAAEMQSQVTKTRNFEQAAADVAEKMQTNPESVTSEDAAHLKSREARATGVAQPPSDSMSAQAQRMAAVNEGDTKVPSKGEMDPATQSAADRVENFEKVAEEVAPKMANAPEQVTKEDASLLHSREQRAFGETSKGGIASQAQSMASENEKK